MVSCEVFVCASALHSDSTYATFSCSLPHILHLTSCFVLVLVFPVPLLVQFMDSCHRWCWGSLPFRHPSKAVFVQVFFIPSVCHQLSLSSFLLYLLISPALHCFLSHSPIFCFPTTSSSLVWPSGSSCCRSGFIPSSSAYLHASFTRDCRLVQVVFSSNSRASPTAEFGSAYKCTAALILVILYSASKDFIPRTPVFRGR